LLDINNYNNSREIYLVNTSGKKTSYTDISAGKTKTVTFKVDGSGTRYRADSMVGVTFRYDGLKYYVIMYVDGSYGEIYLAEDVFG